MSVMLAAPVMLALWVTARCDAQGTDQGSGEKPPERGLLVGSERIDFSREIRPILSDACFACHGPDASHREADLRLDRPGSAAIVPGDLESSAVWDRIRSDDPEAVMPPPHTGKTLTSAQVALIGRWIEAGAAYAEHWAFVPPKVAMPLRDEGAASDLAEGARATWSRGAIDDRIWEGLSRAGLSPSPEADRATLLRRLHLDLTGLPPTPEAIRGFVEDRSPDAYEREVDRLLASPHFGERWGRVWLDAARYADSDGFEKDKPRSVWFYRDWVVRAINDDLPYDEFIRKQIAGDRLPGATQDDLVATGFLRNSMINEEGGVDPEQFRMEAMFDRMDAIGKSMLGLTLQCAQCHSHKYDPLSHTEYYALFAMLNNCHEASVTVFTPEEAAAREATFDRLRQVIEERLARDPGWQSRLARWESAVREGRVSDWRPIEITFNPESIGGQKFLPQGDGSYLAAGYAPTKFHPTGDVTIAATEAITAIRIEMLSDPNLPHGGPGRSVDGTWALSEVEVSEPQRDPQGNETWQQVPWCTAEATIDLSPTPLPTRYADKTDTPRRLGGIGFAYDGDPNTAWHGDAGPGRRNTPQTAVFLLSQPIEPAGGGDSGAEPAGVGEVRFRIKLSQNHGGWNSDDNQTNNLGRFRVSVTSDPAPAIATVPPRVMEALARPVGERDDATRWMVLEHFIRQDRLLSDLVPSLEEVWRGYPEGQSQLVLLERDEPRVTHRLDRGSFLAPQEPVAPGLPGWLAGSVAVGDRADGSARAADRLDLARWLSSPENPLPARSFVNRIWQEYFGTGIVATSDDLGMQGEPPSHPELLDTLAAEFIAGGWGVKSLHRRIVLSSTYRQSSAVTADRLERDPNNRLLSRAPRVRLPAETYRDVVLAAAGMLDRRVGGAPVYPPAPEFLFKPPASYGPKSWGPVEGGTGHRRALYAFRFRSVPYPVLETFDAPNADVACVRRAVSNTPLQALVSLNEPVFVEAARGLAKLAIASRSDGGDARGLDQLFLSLVGRAPGEDERAIMSDLLGRQRQRFASDLAAARAIVGVAGAGKGVTDDAVAAEWAAWTLVCRVVMNLDETVAKP
jgi:hypothetical protein